MKMNASLLAAFALSGMAALIYEITWIRPLQFIFGSTIHIISIIFAAFMLGLSGGSFLAGRYADRIKKLPESYASMEILIGLYGILLVSIFGLLPNFYNSLSALRSDVPAFMFIQFFAVFALLLVPTFLMGATFPVISRLYVKEKKGRGIGEIYSANNIGAIAGSLAAGFLLIPLAGIQYSILFAAAANIVAASIILYSYSGGIAKKAIPLSFALFILLGIFSTYNISALHSYGFLRSKAPENQHIAFYEEGTYSTVSVVREGDVLALLINGKGQGSTVASDVRVNMLLAYLPVLLKANASDALVIGLGTGTTSGQLSQFMNTKTIEIEPVVVEASKLFNTGIPATSANNNEIVIADARNYLSSTDEKYDVIATEPTDPWYSFSSNLYSREFFEIINKSLNNDGIFLQWVPISTMSPQDFRSFYSTFHSVFPHVIIFTNMVEGEQPGLNTRITELILIGSQEWADPSQIYSRYGILPESAKEQLSSVRLDSAEDIMRLFMFTENELEGYGEESPYVTDDLPRLEFSTSIKAMSQDPLAVVNDMKEYAGERSVR